MKNQVKHDGIKQFQLSTNLLFVIFLLGITSLITLSGFHATRSDSTDNIASVVPGEHQSGLLIKKGKAYATIVLPAGADTAEKYAANDLQQVLYDMTGVKLPVADDKYNIEGNRVLIGNTRFTGDVVSDTERSGLGKEDYIARLKGKDLALVGGGPYGTVYAVSELYDTLGARWYMPGELGACLPHLKEIRFRNLDLRRSPSFSMRWIGTDFQWNMRNRQNHVFSGDNMPPAFSVEPEIFHTQEIFMPNTYFDSHPEYFALVDGKRSTNAHFRKLCNSNPDIPEIMAQNMAVLLRKNPRIDLISLSPTDGQLWCECEKCKAMDEPGVPEDQKYSRRQMLLYNQIAAKLEKEFPNLQILVGAYDAYTWPPKDPRIYAHRNLAVIITHFAPYCLAHPTNDPDCTGNRRYLELIKRWKEQTPNVYIYEYYFKGNWLCLPWPIVSTIKEDIPFYHQLGLKGMYSQYNSKLIWGDFLAQYVAARLLWNHEDDVDAILGEFYNKFYGKAAPVMREYHEMLEKQMAANKVNIEGNAPQNWHHVFPEEVQKKMQDYISQAQSMDRDSMVLRRIEKMALLTDYTKKMCLMLEHYQKAGELTNEEARAEYREALDVFQEIERDYMKDPQAYTGVIDRNGTLYRPFMRILINRIKAGINGKQPIKEDKAIPNDLRLK